MKQLITLTANNQNKRKHEVLVATLGRKEVRVRVSVGAAKKRRHIGQDEALPIMGTDPSFLK